VPIDELEIANNMKMSVPITRTTGNFNNESSTPEFAFPVNPIAETAKTRNKLFNHTRQIFLVADSESQKFETVIRTWVGIINTKLNTIRNSFTARETADRTKSITTVNWDREFIAAVSANNFDVFVTIRIGYCKGFVGQNRQIFEWG